MIVVRVLLFGHYREASPVQAVSDGVFRAEIAEGATVAQLATTLAALDPRLADLLLRTRVAVGTEFAGPDTVLTSGDEVAFLPPMSGG